jgi:N-terminal domain of galactosyltransferase
LGPSIAFIIPFWGDEPYRRQSFAFLNNALNEHYKGAFDPPAMAYTGIGNNKNRSAARNELAAKAVYNGADILVFIDADSVPDFDAVEESIGHVMLTKTYLFPYSKYYNLTEAGSKDFMENPPWPRWRPEDSYDYEYVFPGPDPFDRPAAVGGCIIVHKDAFKEVHGYDERFQGWGGEDRAFVLALEVLAGDPGLETLRYPASIYHLWHPAPDSERFDHPNWEYNRQLLERYKGAHPWPKYMTDLVNEH